MSTTKQQGRWMRVPDDAPFGKIASVEFLTGYTRVTIECEDDSRVGGGFYWLVSGDPELRGEEQ